MVNLIEKIIKFEWNEFQHVENEGGRASCQDNWETFEIARKSQFLSWNEGLLESYYDDLLNAKNQGRNLLTEKYARMMENTAPNKYEKLKHRIPVISNEKKSLIKEIIRLRVKWAEEFAVECPNISGNGRLIHSYEDNDNDTSIETYLRGELGTYSEKTVKLYYEYVKMLGSQGKNLSRMIMDNTAQAYGYESLDEAEKKLDKKI